ncbi:MAG: 2-hydroxyacid dehydrogenase [Nitrospinaceae bacterium]|nr:MAG: 2-hydroxyacid dehydrogenase [Nitrospinaceae bacterium]
MADSRPRIAVTPPAFCKSATLRDALCKSFPQSIFNEKNRYLTEPELITFLQDAEGAIIGRDPVHEKMIKALPRLKIIAKYGVGLDNIDQEALCRHNVKFGWTGGTNSLSVAELTLGFMIGLCHNTFSRGFALKQNDWQKDGGTQLTGKTVGIIGCGHAGSEVVRLLAPFQCRILVRDIVDKTGFCRNHAAQVASLDEVIEQSDILTLHVPLTDATRNLVAEKTLAQMKSTAFLINTSRGEVVDQNALKASLKNGGIAGAALDVFSKEPPEDAEFLALPNLIATPHIGGNTVEAVEAMGRAAIAHLEDFFRMEK